MTLDLFQLLFGVSDIHAMSFALEYIISDGVYSILPQRSKIFLARPLPRGLLLLEEDSQVLR